MDITALRYAVSLSEELHFGRAARRHFISAQPFGQRIQRLEREMGVELFTRTSRRVSLTEHGRRVVAEARAALAIIDRLGETARSPVPVGDPLHLGVLGFGLAELWADVRSLLLEHHPRMGVVHHDLDLGSQYQAVITGAVDAGVVQYCGPVDGLVFEPAMTSPRVAVVPVWSPLAESPQLTERDLEGRPWVRLETPHESMSAWLGVAGAPDRRTPGVRTPGAIPTAVATTGAIGMHAAAAERFFPHPLVRFVPLEGPPVEVALATREQDDRPAVEALRSVVRALSDDGPLQAVNL